MARPAGLHRSTEIVANSSGLLVIFTGQVTPKMGRLSNFGDHIEESSLAVTCQP